MLLAIAGVVAGLVALTFAADHFVLGAARLAGVLRLSPVVIGAVVIGFGTSAPELVVSGLAAAQGSVDLGIGNVIGSNVANLTLVLGTAALLTPIVVVSPVLRREAPLSLLAVLLFAVLVRDGLSLLDGALLAAVLLGSLTVIVHSARRGDAALTSEVAEYLEGTAPSPAREWARTGIGLTVTVAAAQLLVVSATTIAAELGLSEGFVGLTIVAIGTSLPELATAVQAARRRELDLIVGNLLGSNLFNAGAVGATLAFIGPGQLADPAVMGPALLLMVAVAALATVFMATGRIVQRWEGAVLLVGYLATLPVLAR